jgi:endonuclease YncB( thermonuclease family)
MKYIKYLAGIGITLLVLLLLSNAWADDEISPEALAQSASNNVYMGYIMRIVDGDTVDALVSVWLDQFAIVRIRLLVADGSGIDTPELQGKCDKEKVLAKLAKAKLQELLPVDIVIHVTMITHDKYGGRINAAILIDGAQKDVGWEMVKTGYAVTYNPNEKRKSWC